jgi:hypothetical protein
MNMISESLRGANYPQTKVKEVAGEVLGFVKNASITAKEKVQNIVPKALNTAKGVATLVAGAKAGQVVAELAVRAIERTQDLQYFRENGVKLSEVFTADVQNAVLNPSVPGISHLSTISERVGWLPSGVSSSVELAIEQKDPSYLKYIPEHVGEDLANIGHSVGEFLGWGASVMLVDFALAQITSAIATNEKTPDWLRKDLVDNSSYLAPWNELTTRQKFVRTTNAIALGSIVDAFVLTQQYSSPICKFVECG